ncbi:hypothetical protein FHX37_1882 [Haloactinospora alba]|uniref:Uncharacterized protein n=1 Tax=Haloactinospora alba TaxID=405555 RepID=A0A543NJG4_9ACTN|nr:hypothetical protein FHX37_1882 [Haloactinospora alba]
MSPPVNGGTGTAPALPADPGRGDEASWSPVAGGRTSRNRCPGPPFPRTGSERAASGAWTTGPRVHGARAETGKRVATVPVRRRSAFPRCEGRAPAVPEGPLRGRGPGEGPRVCRAALSSQGVRWRSVTRAARAGARPLGNRAQPGGPGAEPTHGPGWVRGLVCPRPAGGQPECVGERPEARPTRSLPGGSWRCHMDGAGATLLPTGPLPACAADSGPV